MQGAGRGVDVADVLDTDGLKQIADRLVMVLSKQKLLVTFGVKQVVRCKLNLVLKPVLNSSVSTT